MKHFNYLLLMMIIALFSNCKKETPTPVVETNEDTTFSQGKEAYQTALSEIDNNLNAPFYIDSFYVDSENLYIDVSYSGGCEEHEFQLIWDAEASSRKYNICILHENNDDNCEALITKTLSLSKSHFDVNEKAFEFISALGYKTTVSLGAAINDPEEITIETGSSFGECNSSSCIKVLVADQNLNYTYHSSWAGDTIIIESRTTLTDAWGDLVDTYDNVSFSALDSVYGCPDCTDGGSEWIKITDSKGSKKVTFEYGDTLETISRFHNALRVFSENKL